MYGQRPMDRQYRQVRARATAVAMNRQRPVERQGAGGDGGTTSDEMLCCVGGAAVAGGEATQPCPRPPDGDVVHTTLFV